LLLTQGEKSADDRLHEECGIFGVYGHTEAAEMTFYGLYALQHRGQESSGIAVGDGTELRCHRGMGLVAEVFDPEVIAGLPGHVAIGHNRYSTYGAVSVANAQPLLVKCRAGTLAVAHNGNLVNAGELRHAMEVEGSIFQSNSDTEAILHLAARSRASTLVEMLAESLQQIRGAASLLFASPDTLVAYRDPHGFRPLALGRVGKATVVASETCAFDLLDAEWVRDIRPGELLLVGPEGMRSTQIQTAPRLHQCIFEHIYFARPDSKVFGENVDRARRRCGKQLAREHPAQADIVISVPDSSNTAAMGYAQVSGIRYEIGLIRNHYIGRTFINPEPGLRSFGVRVKFNPVAGVLRGRRVVVVDDSIVRGTTMQKLVRLIRGAGATEVHLRIASPPISWPCFYGIDTPAREELIAARESVEEIRTSLGVDSLGYLSLEGLRHCVEDPENYCTACFDGEYPVDPFGAHENAARRRATIPAGAAPVPKGGPGEVQPTPVGPGRWRG
jgi:amidophosphoribosyltransferase